MNLSRRHLAAAGALALSAPTLIRSAHAEAADETAVKTAVEELRMAWFKQDKAKLDSLTADQLSYSHSDAHLEDKTQFINGVMTRKATFKSLEWPELTVQVVGNSAVVRHLWVSESELDGKVTNTKIGVMPAVRISAKPRPRTKRNRRRAITTAGRALRVFPRREEILFAGAHDMHLLR